MNKSQLRAVNQGEAIHPRELARRIIREQAESLPGGVAEVHDVNRTDPDKPAPALPVDTAIRKGTYEIPKAKAPID